MVVGTVWIDGAVPRDTTVRPTSDGAVCGNGHPAQTIAVDDGRVGGAIVWLSDIRAGKRLPIERLYEVRHVGCRLAPRVQAVLTGGTLNVRSADPVSHHTRFTHTHTGDTVAVVRHSDAGSVVPVQTVVARAGLVQLSCDVHPWTTGWLAVFDHPYVTTTGPDGQFVLPEVPAGRYTLVVWHERLGSETREIVVPGGRTSLIEVRYRL